MNILVITIMLNDTLIITHNTSSVNKCISVCSTILYPLYSVVNNKDLFNTVLCV